MINIAIIGSREFNKYDEFKTKINLVVKELKAMYGSDTIISIISGGAKGADSFAKQYARENLYLIKEIKPEWSDVDESGKRERVVIKQNKYGLYNANAGNERNHDIIVNSDMVVAFVVGYSKGTAHSVHIAQNLYEKDIILFQYDDRGNFKYKLNCSVPF